MVVWRRGTGTESFCRWQKSRGGGTVVSMEQLLFEGSRPSLLTSMVGWKGGEMQSAKRLKRIGNFVSLSRTFLPISPQNKEPR